MTTVQKYTWRVAHIHTVNTQVSQAWTYEAKHGSHITVVIWKLWEQMHLQRRRPHSVCLKRSPNFSSSTYRQKNSWRILSLTAITTSQTKMLFSSTLHCTRTAVGEQMRAGICSGQGRESSYGTLDIVSF